MIAINKLLSPLKMLSVSHELKDRARIISSRVTEPPTTDAALATGIISLPERLAILRAVCCSKGWKIPGPRRKLKAQSMPKGVYISAPRSLEATEMKM